MARPTKAKPKPRTAKNKAAKKKAAAPRTKATRRPATSRDPDARPSGLVLRSEAARALGVSPNRISKWVADGAPAFRRGVRGVPSLYDVEALRRWRDDRDAATQEKGVSVEIEKAKLNRINASIRELDLRQRQGDLVEASAVIHEGRAVLAALKAALLRLPRAMVMQGVIPREGEEAVRSLVVDALRELARWKMVGETVEEGGQGDSADQR